ncbi:H-NS family nucleoid-associated regulatory protein [Aquincola sp. J276]|uniref:H-NS family nucleoid-associated regulatory protein n=1 Tax=Aquincola sp. J276 TaxID=2898432 RepID=UPI00215070DB|nr:H-NS family nucleoid-associated regulatory protein [Aquincola sp. J276]MCR5868145.1 H-NS histone family protein [Aquincola sp. J276]
MAKKSFADLQAEIQKLQAQADALREEEKAGVVARIREAITAYELTERDLFGTTSRVAAKKRGRPARSAGAREVAYADGTGNVWGGRGPRPRWLREALQQGKSLEDFATSGRQSPSGSGDSASASLVGDSATDHNDQPARRGRKPGRRPDPAAKGAVNKRPVKYRDASGNTWSGRGLRPNWLKAALASGSSLESFLVEA